MERKQFLTSLYKSFLRPFLAWTCALLLIPGDVSLAAGPAQDQEAAPSAQEEKSPPIPPDQLDSLVAPIALYPDSLVAQTLAASTYPLEIIQLRQWMEKNQGLKDEALADAVSKQPWDASVQALAAFPEVVKRLADDIQWTTDLGNAFLDQQSDVMDAVQRMRGKAQQTGALKSSEQQKVETKTIEDKTVIIVESASPQVVYVPQYNPVVVYGPPVYPYPPIYYPPPPSAGAVVAASLISFGVGVAIGAAWGHGGRGWGCGWGHRSRVNININNTFVKRSRTNINVGNRVGNRNEWQHNPKHRGGAPYSNRATASKFGGTARGTSRARPQPAPRPSSRGLSSGTASAGRPSAGSSRIGNRAATNPDRIGSRDIPRSSPSARGGGAFGSGSGSFDGKQARAARSRGSQSMKSQPSRSSRPSRPSRPSGGRRR